MKTPFYLLTRVALAVVLLLAVKSTSAQNIFPANGAVGIGTATPNASSLLDITSITKGVLLPRMTKSQRDAIAAPATGLLIYQTNSNAGFYYYAGSGWSPVTPKPGWLLKGNSGIDPSSNFLGTTDAQPVVIKTNNAEVMRISSNGNVGIGTANPAAMLQVSGDVIIDGVVNGIDVGTGGGSGLPNTAVGFQSLQSNTTGDDNSAFGNSALFANTDGTGNSAFGNNSLHANISGSSNTASGYNSLLSNNSGSGNTASGYYALAANTSGKNNVAEGYAALGNNKGGNNNTALGYSADVAADGLSNATVIGNGAVVDASNKVRIGDASVSSYSCQVNWTAGSDVRIKDQVQENVAGLNFITQLRPVTFHYNVAKQQQLLGMTGEVAPDGGYEIEKIAFSGFIAQEVDAAAAKAGYDFSGVDKSGNVMGLRYAEFVVPLTKAVQELAGVNKDLQSENEQLSLQVATQQQQLDVLQSQVNQLLAGATSPDDAVAKISFAPLLGQNIPNPLDNSTVIPFSIPKGCESASIMITESPTGKIVAAIPVRNEKTFVVMETGTWPSGTYQYALYADGKILDARQMVIAR